MFFTTCQPLVFINYPGGLWLSLTNLNPSHLLIKLPLVDLDIWVDALTSWDIGLWVGGLWAAWQLVSGWSNDGQYIGWAEATAIELAMAWMTQSGWNNACLKICCDNNSVIYSFWKGHSCFPARNQTLCSMTASLASKICPSHLPTFPLHLTEQIPCLGAS